MTTPPRTPPPSPPNAAPTLLHVSSSPRGQTSQSLAIAESYITGYRETHPGAVVDTFDLWDGSLPPFGPAATRAKMAAFAGQDPAPEDAAAWQAARDVFARFDAAAHYLFSVPMWNAGLPYVLKQFIDVISQPGLVFTFDPETGYTGLLRGKKAAVVHTSAVWGPGRPPSFGSNFAEPYLHDWLRWTGIEDITTITHQPNLAATDPETSRQTALVQAYEAGASS